MTGHRTSQEVCPWNVRLAMSQEEFSRDFKAPR